MNSRALYSAQPANGWLPWGALVPVLAFVFVVVPAVGTSFLLEHWQLADARGRIVGVTGMMALLVVTFPVIALVVLGWVRFVERRPLATVGLVGSGGMRLFLRGHAIGLATVSIVVSGIWLAGGYRADGVAKAFGSAGTLAGYAMLLFGFALQSSVEEIVFRGWLLSGIARKFNVLIAVMLTSVVFALLHYSADQPALAMVGTFGFSVFACCWALNAGNLWGVMGWHSGWNWLLAIGFELPLSGVNPIEPALLVKLVDVGPSVLTGGSHGPEASLLCTIFFAVVSAGLVYRLRRGHARPPHPQVVGGG